LSKSLLQELKSPWELILTEPAPENIEFRPSDWPEKYQKSIFLANQQVRSSRVTLSPSYTKWFSSSIDLLGPHSGKIFVESFREKKIERSRGNRKEAVTWGLESDNLPSIFSADLSKVFSTFLWPMYATSTLLFLITVKASPAHKLTYYFSSIVEQLLKRSTLCANRRTTGHTTMLSERGKNALITSGFSAGTLLLSRQTKMQLSSSSVR